MVIDSHYHLDKRLLTIEELLERMDASGIDKVALMASMCDPFHEPAKFLITILQFFLTHRWLRRVGKLFVANFTDGGDVKLPGGVCRVYSDPDNESVFKATRDNPDRFLGWIFVNPRGNNDQVREFKKWKDSPGFIGVKAHPFWHHFSPIELEPVAEQVKAMGKPLLIHAGYDSHGDYDALLNRVPDLKLILAHAGFPLYSDAWEAIRPRKNVFVDLSQTSYVGEKTMHQVVEYLGVERCIFGTDGPFGFPAPDAKFDYGFIKRRIERLFPDKGVQRRLLGENFAELVGIQ